jgi:translation initiation factor 1 (eIF-1/SUI1)
MSRKPRISTDGAPPLSSNPFAALQGALGDLPAGEVIPAELEFEPEPAPMKAPPLLHGKLVLRRETKGRGGKTATVIEGLRLPETVLQDMAQQLRRHLGCGAHVEGTTIVLSGAQTERIRDWLSAQGATRIVIGN